MIAIAQGITHEHVAIGIAILTFTIAAFGLANHNVRSRWADLFSRRG